MRGIFTRSALLFSVGALLTLVAAPNAFAIPISDCGTLIQGVECVLFDSDNYGTYVLDDYGSFQPGDRVWVSGDFDPGCVTICMQGNGCIFVDQIIACGAQFTDCGLLQWGVECILFHSDNHGVYVLSDLGGFQAGDRVRVTGFVDPNCITFCMQGNGCIQVTAISGCSVDNDEPRWGTVKSRYGGS